jgi:hypothetical protein
MGGFLPRTDAGLLLWANGFSAQITATPTVFGLVAAQATSFASTLSTYSSALNAATNDSTRTKGTVAAKNTARNSLRAACQSMAAIVQAFPSITPMQLENLGLTVRDHGKTPVPAPGLAPRVTVKKVTGRVVSCLITDASIDGGRRRPPNADGATIMSAVGDVAPPAGDSGWKLEGQTGKNLFNVQFSNDVAPGATCWIVALWYNKRGEYSPACDPVQTYLQIGPATAAA